MVRSEVLTAMSLMMAIFWDVVPCSLLDTDRRFRGDYWVHHHDITMTTVDIIILTELSPIIYLLKLSDANMSNASNSICLKIVDHL
jgi:hypothetical protein